MTAKRNRNPVTKIEGNRVKMSRKAWYWFVAETDKELGLDLSGMVRGKGTVTIALEVWKFHLAVLAAAVDYSGARARGGGNGCQDCCDEECRGLGGCDFCYGSVGVCKDGDLVICEAAA